MRSRRVRSSGLKSFPSDLLFDFASANPIAGRAISIQLKDKGTLETQRTQSLSYPPGGIVIRLLLTCEVTQSWGRRPSPVHGSAARRQRGGTR